jgi:hypothetical protein
MREKQLKEWRRDWKIALIEATNPDWADLYAASPPDSARWEIWIPAFAGMTTEGSQY